MWISLEYPPISPLLHYTYRHVLDRNSFSITCPLRLPGCKDTGSLEKRDCNEECSLNIIPASKALLRCGLRHPEGFLGFNTCVKYNTPTQPCSRRFDTPFVTLFRLIPSAKMAVGEAASDTAREHLWSFSIFLNKTVQESTLFLALTPTILQVEKAQTLQGSIKKREHGCTQSMKLLQANIQTKHLLHNLYSFTTYCGLVLKIQTQNLICFKKRKNVSLLLLLTTHVTAWLCPSAHDMI